LVTVRLPQKPPSKLCLWRFHVRGPPNPQVSTPRHGVSAEKVEMRPETPMTSSPASSTALRTLIVAVFLFAATQAFGTSLSPRRADPNADASGAGMLLIPDGDAFREAPPLATDVAIEVTGILARTHIRQRFTNPTTETIEAVYVFPLPESAAVDTLEMQIGERRIFGRVEERAEAQSMFERAKSEGRKASLIEQERPNLFTSSIANLGPGESVTITFAYHEDLRYDAGRFSLRVPMVAKRRYVGDDATRQSSAVDGAGTPTREAPDAERINPPVADPLSSWAHRVRIGVQIASGFPLERVSSNSHAIEVVKIDEHHHEVRLKGGSVLADRDFLLEWEPRRGSAPTAALFREQREDAEYALLMVLPPDEDQTRTRRLSRETILVIDTSGSMAGDSIGQARESVMRALDTLRPEDAFNVIAFASAPRPMFDESRPATREAVEAAREFVRGLVADGGTEMAPALGMALSPGSESRAVRQVVFVTDGAVGDEQRLFSLIATKLGRSRLYTVGIGSAPNAHFMTKAAEWGRGTFTYIARPDDVAREMTKLFEKIERPVLHDLDVDWGLESVEAWPQRIPDVYAGEPVVLAVRSESAVKRAVLEGRRGDERMSLKIPLLEGSAYSGIDKLWARRKVAAEMDSLQTGATIEEVSRRVAELGVRHQIVTRWSSLVAVDSIPTASTEAPAVRRSFPSHLPAGTIFEKIFGKDPEPPPAPSPNLRVADLRLASLNTLAAYGAAGRLPQGGTAQDLLLQLGLILLVTSLVVLRAEGASIRRAFGR
jgi:Ca-activated chloride channel family protein